MGRGRAKAKQQKVARRLKYNSGHTDLDQLRSELGVAEDDGTAADSPEQPADPYDDLVDRYADLADEYQSGDEPAEESTSDRSDSLR
ncbi:DUF3073 domain-containing protein [Streptomonospora litoralis]|uniref:DUF3073 domain-containing protein n=1 Tax=Streptomonospora litoralis TaxID=2498135 RepID=A0A4P6PWU1_9ACTN|nr:DUF3073 domain-containing protein [Streptomonospora litoralis]QBI52130.1 hypothetical protein EKD16_01565 [Streptomonospora litoralis]